MAMQAAGNLMDFKKVVSLYEEFASRFPMLKDRVSEMQPEATMAAVKALMRTGRIKEAKDLSIEVMELAKEHNVKSSKILQARLLIDIFDQRLSLLESLIRKEGIPSTRELVHAALEYFNFSSPDFEWLFQTAQDLNLFPKTVKLSEYISQMKMRSNCRRALDLNNMDLAHRLQHSFTVDDILVPCAVDYSLFVRFAKKSGIYADVRILQAYLRALENGISIENADIMLTAVNNFNFQIALEFYKCHFLKLQNSLSSSEIGHVLVLTHIGNGLYNEARECFGKLPTFKFEKGSIELRAQLAMFALDMKESPEFMASLIQYISSVGESRFGYELGCVIAMFSQEKSYSCWLLDQFRKYNCLPSERLHHISKEADLISSFYNSFWTNSVEGNHEVAREYIDNAENAHVHLTILASAIEGAFKVGEYTRVLFLYRKFEPVFRNAQDTDLLSTVILAAGKIGDYEMIIKLWNTHHSALESSTKLKLDVLVHIALSALKYYRSKIDLVDSVEKVDLDMPIAKLDYLLSRISIKNTLYWTCGRVHCILGLAASARTKSKQSLKAVLAYVSDNYSEENVQEISLSALNLFSEKTDEYRWLKERLC